MAILYDIYYVPDRSHAAIERYCHAFSRDEIACITTTSGPGLRRMVGSRITELSDEPISSALSR
jgi:hypothetical protein